LESWDAVRKVRRCRKKRC